MRYAFIRTQERAYRVTRLCHALAVSRSGYYAWRDRPASARAVEDQRVLHLLRQLHQEMREEYGAIKLWREATRRGIRCGRHRVARLRKLGRLETKRVRRFRVIVEHHQLPPPAPNLLQQSFCDDRTQPRLGRRFHHGRDTGGVALCGGPAGSVFTAGDRLGHEEQAGPTAHTGYPGDGRPPTTRRAGLIHHSDQGAQYSALLYQRRLAEMGITPSMSRKGNCYDNAVAESFFSTLKNELIHHQIYHTRDDARREIFAFIEGFYNRQRLHQSLGYLSPMQFERQVTES